MAREDHEPSYRDVFRSTSGNMAILAADGTIVDVNPAALARRPESVDQLIGLPFWEAPWLEGLPEQRDATRRAVAEAAAGRRVRGHVRFRGRDGEVRLGLRSLTPVGDETGRVRFIVAEGHDITELKRAEEALRENEQQLRTLLDHAPEAVVVLDVDSGRFVDVNENAAALFELPRSELLLRGPADMSPPVQPDGRESGPAAKDLVEAALEGETPFFEWTHRTASGRDVPCEVRLVRLPAKGRRLVRGSVTDVSDRRASEEERRQLEEQLRQAQRMEMVGQLAGGIAHDFNNLLQAIIGNVDLVASDVAVESSHRRALAEAAKAADVAAALTRKLLAFSRRQVIQPVPLDLEGTLAGLLDVLRRLLPPRIELAFEPAGAVDAVEADATQLEQVVVNLIVNARDAIDEAGRIALRTANVTVDEEFCRAHPWAVPGPHVLLEVEDTGRGIPGGDRQRIFEPFFTTKPPGEGTGLGLAMVYGIVKQHGGMVLVDSTVAEGSRFSVYLPAAGELPRPQPGTGTACAAGGAETILVAEDDDMVRELVVTLLREAGYRVLEASDGSEALEAFSRDPDGIDLVLLDVVMPRSSGKETYERMRQIRPELPVLLTSGYSGQGVGSDFVLASDVGFLAKPHRPEVLLIRVRQCLDRPTGSAGRNPAPRGP